MRHYDRFIPGEEIKDVAQWQFGAIDTVAQLLQARVQARQAQEELVESAAQQQQAYQDGYAAGVVQGKQQAEQALQQQMHDFLANQGNEAARQLAQLFESAQRQLQEAEQAMAQGLLNLACEVARQVLRRELAVDNQAVLPVLKEALTLLQAEHKTTVVKLPPSDLAALGELIQTEFAGLGLSLRADAALQPGDCVLESAGTVVDGTVQKRWQRAVATLGLSSTWEQADEPA